MVFYCVQLDQLFVIDEVKVKLAEPNAEEFLVYCPDVDDSVFYMENVDYDHLFIGLL